MNKNNNKEQEQCSIFSVVCSTCGEPLAQHELPANLDDIDEDIIECIPCEIKYWDSADIDNFGT